MLKREFHKPIFLFKLLGICLLFLLAQRVLFLSLFYQQFVGVSFSNYVKAFLIGTLTDAIVALVFMAPMWLLLLFGNIQSRLVRLLSLLFFSVGFLVLSLLNLADLGYYPVTKKRMGSELLDVLTEVPALAKSYVSDYWYLFILLFVFITLAIYVFNRQLKNYRPVSENKYKSFFASVVTGVLFLFIAWGGVGETPFMPYDIPSLVDPKLQWVASNTPFQFLHTLGNKNIATETYFSEEQAEKNIGYRKQFSGSEFNKKNIVFIILESFCSERIGYFNPLMKSYTPFMDSLLKSSRTYEYGMANGRMTIDALPSVLSSLPSLMEKNYCYSNYSNNAVHGISSLLQPEGYSTAFFYGGLKTTFGFQNYMNLNFTKNYFDQRDYDSAYENSNWGVDDHLYLKFVARKMKTLPQPFCTAVLTLSLHQPFPIPEPYKTLLDSIKDPIKKSVRYTDIALQMFFDEIRKEDWFKNSVIAICADHTSVSFGQFPVNSVNEFSIPISFLAPGDTAFNKTQKQSISQIDMFPTILDYLGYNKPFRSLGVSALSSKTHPTVRLIGNGLYHIFDHPFLLEYDKKQEVATKLWRFNADRAVTELNVKEYSAKADSLTQTLKSYLQTFSYRLNKNDM